MNGTKIKFSEKWAAFHYLNIKHPRLIRLLAGATWEHRQVEKEFKKMLSCYNFSADALFPALRLPLHEYFQKNFFSIMFLSTFRVAGIPKQRRILYGLILHSLRTIVTCTDNILDHENKGSVFLNAKIRNPVLNHVLLAWACQNILRTLCDQVSSDTLRSEYITKQILESMYKIARGEDIAHHHDKNRVMNPQDIIRLIHENIGGQLLRLAMIAPLENEPQSGEKLRNIEKGVFEIGVALQMVDDCTDAADDLIAEKQNLLISRYVFDANNSGLPELQAWATNNRERFEAVLTPTKHEIIRTAVEQAIQGFDRLREAGYPIRKNNAMALLKVLFQLRGLANDFEQAMQCEIRGAI